MYNQTCFPVSCFSIQITSRPVFYHILQFLGMKSKLIWQSLQTSFNFLLPTKKTLKCSNCTYLSRYPFLQYYTILGLNNVLYYRNFVSDADLAGEIIQHLEQDPLGTIGHTFKCCIQKISQKAFLVKIITKKMLWHRNVFYFCLRIKCMSGPLRWYQPRVPSAPKTALILNAAFLYPFSFHL